MAGGSGWSRCGRGRRSGGRWSELSWRATGWRRLDQPGMADRPRRMLPAVPSAAPIMVAVRMPVIPVVVAIRPPKPLGMPALVIPTESTVRADRIRSRVSRHCVSRGRILRRHISWTWRVAAGDGVAVSRARVSGATTQPQQAPQGRALQQALRRRCIHREPPRWAVEISCPSHQLPMLARRDCGGRSAASRGRPFRAIRLVDPLAELEAGEVGDLRACLG